MSTRSIPRVGPPEVLPAINAIAEILEIGQGVRGNGDGRFLTVADMTGTGMVRIVGGSTLVRTDPDTGEPVDLTPPPAIEGLTATGALSAILLQWSPVAAHHYAYTEIWRSQDNNRNNAVRIGVSVGTLYADAVDLDSTYFYWVRAVSTASIVGPWNAAYNDGLEAATPASSSTILAQLTEQIRTDQIVWRGQVVYETELFAIVAPRAAGDEGLTVPFVVGAVDGESTVGIDGRLVVDGTIQANAIKAGSITADLLSVLELSAISANLGEVTAGSLDVGPGSWKVRVSAEGYPVEFRNIYSGERRFYLDDLGNAHFTGDINATSGTFSGDITAGSTISGAVIEGGELHIGEPGFHVAVNGDAWSGHEDYASAPLRIGTGGHLQSGLSSNSTHMDNGLLWTGSSSFAAAPFRVDAQGNLYANSIAQAQMEGYQPEIDNLWMDALYLKNLTADKILAGELQAGVVVAGSLIAGEITAATISAERIEAGFLAVDRLEAGTAYITDSNMVSQGVLSDVEVDTETDEIMVLASLSIWPLAIELDASGGKVVLTFSCVIRVMEAFGGGDADAVIELYGGGVLLRRVQAGHKDTAFSHTVAVSGVSNSTYNVKVANEGVGGSFIWVRDMTLVGSAYKR